MTAEEIWVWSQQNPKAAALMLLYGIIVVYLVVRDIINIRRAQRTPPRRQHGEGSTSGI